MTTLASESITQVRVDTKALMDNFKYIQDLVGGETRVSAVVKADAYGHGLERAAQAFHEAGCRHFSVASLEEACRLRKLWGDDVTILKVVPSLPSQFEDALNLGVEEVLVSADQRREWSEWLESKQARMAFHLKVDRGMGRLGFSYEELLRELINFKDSERISIVGVMSHLPASEEDPDSASTARMNGQYHTTGEIRRFSELVGEIRTLLGGKKPIFHLANSGATLFHSNSHFDLVRVGLALYGADPRGEDGSDLGLQPAMSLVSHIVQIRAIPTGTTIGYNREFVAPKPMFVAAAPVGYSDGFAWNLRSNAKVLVQGRLCSVIGRISMNLISIDISSCDGVKWGDPVVLLGKQADARISVEEIAKGAKTIPYEVLTSIGRLAPCGHTL
ncbi:MAG: alanine racemase [Candidatus Omnitrophica bacterium]|nr:alanine racemase [Candidatus Omnitrophota bacterium]MCA9436561.1 alanine racemase [Candidatus Omnitrophota bacterium]